MNEKDIKALVDNFVPYIEKQLKDSTAFKNIARITTGNVISADNTNKTCVVKIPYDNTQMTVPIQTYEELSAGDTVKLMYWESFSNLMVIKREEG